MATSIISYSQVVWTNKNVKIMVMPNTTVSINGSMECNSDQFLSAEIENFGQLTLSQNFASNSSVNPFDKLMNGKVILVGNESQKITGNKDLSFINLEINKSAGQVLLQTNVAVEDSLIMSQGNIFLNSYHISLPINARLFYEKESSRIGDSLGGYIEAEILNDDKENILGLEFNKTSLSQGIKITRYHFIDTTISTGSVQRVYKITASANDRISNLQFSYFKPELNDLIEQDLSLFYRYDEESRWIKDNTSLVDASQSRVTSTLPHSFPNTTLWITSSIKNCRLQSLGFPLSPINKCQFDTLQLSPKKIFDTYKWSTGSTEPQITVRSTDIYIVYTP